MSEHNTEKDALLGHDFLPVKGHPDDDECTHRENGTDATYCGYTYREHLADFYGVDPDDMRVIPPVESEASDG